MSFSAHNTMSCAADVSYAAFYAKRTTFCCGCPARCWNAPQLTARARSPSGPRTRQVSAEIATASGAVAAASSRPAMLRHRGWAASAARAAVRLPLFAFGLAEEAQTLSVPLFEGALSLSITLVAQLGKQTPLVSPVPETLLHRTVRACSATLITPPLYCESAPQAKWKRSLSRLRCCVCSSPQRRPRASGARSRRRCTPRERPWCAKGAGSRGGRCCCSCCDGGGAKFTAPILGRLSELPRADFARALTRPAFNRPAQRVRMGWLQAIMVRFPVSSFAGALGSDAEVPPRSS